MTHAERIQSLVAQLSLAYFEAKLADIRGSVSPLSTPKMRRPARKGGPTFPMPGSASEKILGQFKASKKQTIGSLVESLGLSSGLVSTTLNGLKARGLVRRGARTGEWVATGK